MNSVNTAAPAPQSWGARFRKRPIYFRFLHCWGPGGPLCWLPKIGAGGPLLALLLTGCSHPAPPPAPPTQTSGGVSVTLTSTLSPHTGDNTLTVRVVDAKTQAPVGNANLTATPEMLAPRTPGAVTSGRAQGDGVYTVPVRLAIPSRYDIELKIERPGLPPASVTFPVEASE